MTYSRQWLQESEMRLERQSLALPELKGRSPYACLLLTLPEAGTTSIIRLGMPSNFLVMLVPFPPHISSSLEESHVL